MKKAVMLYVFMTLVAPGMWAAKHPVPLDPKADPATCIQCHNSDDDREFGGSGPQWTARLALLAHLGAPLRV